jgi:hypothetical protein
MNDPKDDRVGLVAGEDVADVAQHGIPGWINAGVPVIRLHVGKEIPAQGFDKHLEALGVEIIHFPVEIAEIGGIDATTIGGDLFVADTFSREEKRPLPLLVHHFLGALFVATLPGVPNGHPRVVFERIMLAIGIAPVGKASEDEEIVEPLRLAVLHKVLEPGFRRAH